jgi:hypothetical protein
MATHYSAGDRWHNFSSIPQLGSEMFAQDVGVWPVLFTSVPGLFLGRLNWLLFVRRSVRATLPSVRKIRSFCPQIRQHAALSGGAYFCIVPIP